ncbi:MAG TPA: response regulator transcription factor, partial [Candidatus Binatia bacterium]|nr:response regulator transcription factor [Candidatus Binatia bacterium]
MKILIAEDDRVSRRLLDANLRNWGHEVLELADGTAAWEAMQRDDAPDLAIVDWMMPGLDGVEICRRARARSPVRPLYVILLTARTRPEDIVLALDAGADDYVTKPFDAAELRARVGVGIRVVQLQRELAGRIAELEEALAHV